MFNKEDVTTIKYGLLGIVGLLGFIFCAWISIDSFDGSLMCWGELGQCSDPENESLLRALSGFSAILAVAWFVLTLTSWAAFLGRVFATFMNGIHNKEGN